jgi:hypothetical protein
MPRGTAEPLRLEAKRASLARVLDEIAAKAGVRVHHAVLPDELVSVTCAEPTVKEVVECLLGPDANVILRSPSGASKAVRPGQPDELWVLGRRSGGGRADAGAGEVPEARPRRATPIPPELVPNDEETARLAALATAEDPEERVSALSRLAALGRAENALVWKALEAAFSDEDPDVRAQAVHGLSRLGGPAAAAMLQEALHDSEQAVRLMAVSRAGTDAGGVTLLKDALADSDETVSSFAAMKLERLPNRDAAE